VCVCVMLWVGLIYFFNVIKIMKVIKKNHLILLINIAQTNQY
jgi:hypothetical protein